MARKQKPKTWLERLERTYLEDITIPHRLRPLDPQKVTVLAESIENIGLQTPIAVLWVDGEDGEYDLLLVAGHHRLEAARQLGWQWIDAVVFEDADTARLWEIAENLHRVELTVQERADHIAEWVKLTEARRLGSQPAQVAPVNKGGRAAHGQPKEGGINAAVRELGVERTDIQRAVKIAGIAPEAKDAARVAGLADNQSALLAVARAPAADQVAKAREIAEAKAARAKVSNDIVRREPVRVEQQSAIVSPGSAAENAGGMSDEDFLQLLCRFADYSSELMPLDVPASEMLREWSEMGETILAERQRRGLDSSRYFPTLGTAARSRSKPVQ